MPEIDPDRMADRARYYREMGERAQKLANELPAGDQQNGFQKLANDWRALADEVEQKAGLPPRRVNGQ